MIPLIVGGVALTAIGYSMSKSCQKHKEKVKLKDELRDINIKEYFHTTAKSEAEENSNIFDTLHKRKKELFSNGVKKLDGVISDIKNSGLDSIPTKQMAVDAKQSNGVISKEEAKALRIEIFHEAVFYQTLENIDSGVVTFKNEAKINNIVTKKLATEIAKSVDEMLAKAEIMLNIYITEVRNIVVENRDFNSYDEKNKRAVIKAYELANNIMTLSSTQILNLDGAINSNIIKEIHNMNLIYENFGSEDNVDEKKYKEPINIDRTSTYELNDIILTN
ncbi:MAG: hypothetical protein GQ570_05175 [Helicobacteraceae bacterium]|nr:hypothetical protein [Helicobacteraceae bacterium]